MVRSALVLAIRCRGGAGDGCKKGGRGKSAVSRKARRVLAAPKAALRAAGRCALLCFLCRSGRFSLSARRCLRLVSLAIPPAAWVSRTSSTGLPSNAPSHRGTIPHGTKGNNVVDVAYD